MIGLRINYSRYIMNKNATFFCEYSRVKSTRKLRKFCIVWIHLSINEIYSCCDRNHSDPGEGKTCPSPPCFRRSDGLAEPGPAERFRFKVPLRTAVITPRAIPVKACRQNSKNRISDGSYRVSLSCNQGLSLHPEWRTAAGTVHPLTACCITDISPLFLTWPDEYLPVMSEYPW